jgi:folate-binding Fe-S cluster repair protein YgfZ
MHYLGNLKKRQFLGYARERAPEPGELLFAAGGDGQAVGTIVQSAPHPTHGYAALAVIQLSAAASASLHLGTENPIRFEIESTKKPTQ